MYDIKLIEFIVNKLRENQIDKSYEYIGSLNGYIDDSGVFQVQGRDGYRISESKYIPFNFIDMDTESEALPDVSIFSYEFTVECIVPNDLYNSFTQDILVFKEALTGSFYNIDLPDGRKVNTVFKISLPDKADDEQDTGGGSYQILDLVISTTGGIGTHWGNETQIEVRRDTTRGYELDIRLNETDLTGVIVSDYEAEQQPLTGFTYIKYTHPTTGIAIDAEYFPITLGEVRDEEDVIIDPGVTYTIKAYDTIRGISDRSQATSLAPRTFQRRADDRTITVDTGESWATQLAIYMISTEWFHRDIVRQISDKSNARVFDLKITLPTFEPYYRKIILTDVSQSSQLGGIITLGANPKEV